MPAIGDAGVDRRLVRLVAVLLAGAVAALLDTTIVSVAVGDLARAFGAPVAQVQWASSAYLLAMVSVIPVMGWLVGRFGARRLWLGTLVLFLAGSVLCSAAWSIQSLIGFRVLQGLGAGLILPLVQAILVAEAGPRRIGRAMGLVGIPGQLAPILGSVLGGLILASLGWRWIFLVNLPITLVAILLAWRYLPASDAPADPAPGRLDRTGLILFSPALVLVIAGVSQLRPDLAVFGLLLLAGFGYAQCR